MTEKKSTFDKFLDGLNTLVEKFRGERAIGGEQIEQQIYKQVYEKFDYGWPLGVFFEDDGSAFVVIAAAGKLYRMNFEIQNSEVVNVSEPIEVMFDFPERSRAKNDFIIRQQPNGRFRWISFSATSVLNRVGEIDSTALFDSMIEAFESGEAPAPIRQLYHLGENAKTGQVDFMFRRGNVFITSGLYDESPLAMAEIKARQAEPDFWGNSIGYIPTAPPDILELGEVEIPVYNRGIMQEESTLAESDAASWFTSMPILETEVSRMKNLTDAQKDIFRTKIFAGEADPDKKIQELLNGADDINRSIEEAQMIKRSKETDPESDETETEPKTTDANPENAADETEQEIILDDSALDAIAERVGKSGLEAIQALTEKVEGLTQKFDLEVGQLNQELTGLKSRMAEAEELNEVARSISKVDSPVVSTLRVGYRPSKTETPEGETLPAEDRGAAALAKFKAFPA